MLVPDRSEERPIELGVSWGGGQRSWYQGELGGPAPQRYLPHATEIKERYLILLSKS